MTPFDPQKLSLHIAPDGRLRTQIENDRCALDTQILRALPLSKEQEFLSVRDGAGKEIAFLESLDGLDENSKQLVLQALESRYFLPKILKINSIVEKFGSTDWNVETDRGPVAIQSKAIHEALIELGPNRYLLRDNEDNRYEFPDTSTMDEVSRLRLTGKY